MLLVTPAVAIYGRVDPTFTGIVVQRYVEYSAFFHFRSSTMIFLLVVLVIGTYGLHTKLLNGTIGDAFSTIGVVFWSLLAFVNTIRMGITHIILQTIDYAVDTELSYNQAVYFAHHLESVSYGFAVINTLSFGLGIFFFALGLSTKNLHRLNPAPLPGDRRHRLICRVRRNHHQFYSPDSRAALHPDNPPRPVSYALAGLSGSPFLDEEGPALGKPGYGCGSPGPGQSRRVEPAGICVVPSPP